MQNKLSEYNVVTKSIIQLEHSKPSIFLSLYQDFLRYVLLFDHYFFSAYRDALIPLLGVFAHLRSSSNKSCFLKTFSSSVFKKNIFALMRSSIY